MNRILVVIPAYNEEACIAGVIADLKEVPRPLDILVVNDGSKDRTAQVAKAAGAKVLNLPFNLGIGGAVQTGYKYALQNHYDVVVQVDGDGQHDPKELPRILAPLEMGVADLVIGSRFLEPTDYEGSRARQVGIDYFAKLVSRLSTQKFSDTTSGYRGANGRTIRLFANYYPSDYPEVETIVYAAKNHLRLKEVSVNMLPRQGGTSSITPLASIYYMIKVTLALLSCPHKGVNP